MKSRELESLLSMTIPIEGEPHRLRFRLPLWAETLTAVLEPDRRSAARLAGQLGVRIYDLIVSNGDTGRPSLPTVKHWLTKPDIAAALVQRHRDVVEVASEAGTVHLGCPFCEGEVELTLTALAIALGNPMPPIFDGPFFALPPLAFSPPRPPRDGLRTSRQVRFDLPSRELGIDAPLSSGALGELDQDPARPREEALWREWAATADVDPSSPRASWTRDCVGFRVSIRLSVVLSDPRRGAVTPQTIGALPICDVFFLNTLYFLTYAAQPSLPHALTCPRCRGEFTPVR